jgi:hypothetical protein
MSQPQRQTANAKERDQDDERDRAAIAIAVVLGVSQNLRDIGVGQFALAILSTARCSKYANAGMLASLATIAA